MDGLNVLRLLEVMNIDLRRQIGHAIANSSRLNLHSIITMKVICSLSTKSNMTYDDDEQKVAFLASCDIRRPDR